MYNTFCAHNVVKLHVHPKIASAHTVTSQYRNTCDLLIGAPHSGGLPQQRTSAIEQNSSLQALGPGDSTMEFSSFMGNL